MMRLQKFLAQAGIASRRKAEELIKMGKVQVNGQTAHLGQVIDEKADLVEFNSKNIYLTNEYVYFALNKPPGYVCSTGNKEGPSVLGLIKAKQRIFPVGRLDKDSSGLIILTNDGDFALKVSHARYGCEKEYFVVLDQDLSKQAIKKIEKGFTLNNKKLQPAKVLSAKNNSARLALKEGINRQIRRMLGKLGYTVIKLKRIRIGKLELGELKPGRYRLINKEEVI